MFEKSLYDLIRGLRNHKGNERAYIQGSIRECRKEIKSNDMDLKATAVLKLTYLEMFGHDMSWASFNVLEVMSSSKQVHKRIGYLAAIQSFRPDTEVLVLAENLLKKDLMSTQPTVIMLPLLAIPHVINSSMANSLLSDLLPRLTHSNPAIRKKTIVTLYRLALVYPETLRPSWPKITERLQDEGEDPSVTAAVVNVVCELGWRRPRDFLPLAPRLFDLLVNQGNNWIAIKIIKLFATLTPLEPRLVKKLLPPLTAIIKATPAMSLLYECINGIIQGGVLQSVEGTIEGDEIARLCVGKLCSMLTVEGDPNLKFVALLAFQRLVDSHADLVFLHQDVILDCIEDPDISIRMRALDLVGGMVDTDNLVDVVSRLMKQLEQSPVGLLTHELANDRSAFNGIEADAQSDDDDAHETLRQNKERQSQDFAPLPEEYRINIMRKILVLCSHDTYANIADFEWYIHVLVKLVRVCPPVRNAEDSSITASAGVGSGTKQQEVSSLIGDELLNVAVRVKSLRYHATIAAQSLLMLDQRGELFPLVGNGGQGVLENAAWMAGEFAGKLTNPDGVLTSLLDSSSLLLPANILSTYIQAIPKVFATIAGSSSTSWTPQRRTFVVLLLARIVHFFEPLAAHPNLDIQERAVEFLELFRLAAEATSAQTAMAAGDGFLEPPLLLTRALPSLFQGQELNPVASAAQTKVPRPDGINLEAPINQNLQQSLQQADLDNSLALIDKEVNVFYNVRAEGSEHNLESAADRLDRVENEARSISYQQGSAADFLDNSLAAQRRAERREKNRDDPFYIGDRARNPAYISETSSPLGQIIRGSNGETVDIDSIPIMDLDLVGAGSNGDTNTSDTKRPARHKLRRRYDIMTDENIMDSPNSASSKSREDSQVDLERAKGSGSRAKSLLQVDSSSLGSFALNDRSSSQGPRDYEARQTEERMLKEVERLQLEMQRASERVRMRDIVGPEEGLVVKKKKKKRVKILPGESAGAEADPSGPTRVFEDGPTKVSKKKLRKKRTQASQALPEEEIGGEV